MPSTMIEKAIEEIDKEDAEKAMEELKKYLRKGRWERVRHPAFQRGLWAGTASTVIFFVMLWLVIGPFFCGD